MNPVLCFLIKKYKTFSVLIYSYINTSGNWKNEKLCGNTTPAGRSVFTQFRVFPIFTSVDITVYQYGKNVLYFFYNIAQRTLTEEWREIFRVDITDLNYWIKLLSCIIEANGGHIGLSHINLHWYYWDSRRGFYRFRLLVGMDKHCVHEISFTNNFCFFLNLPVNNELGIVQDGRHEFIIKCFKPSQNH